jgi:hypothetical protein
LKKIPQAPKNVLRQASLENEAYVEMARWNIQKAAKLTLKRLREVSVPRRKRIKKSKRDANALADRLAAEGDLDAAWRAYHQREESKRIHPNGISVFKTPFAIDWAKSGERLMRCFEFGGLAAGAHGFSLGRDPAAPDHVLASMAFDGAYSLNTELQIVAVPGGIDFTVIGPNGVRDEDRAEWRRIIKRVIGDFAEPEIHYAWYAVIGSTPEMANNMVATIGTRGKIESLTFGPIDMWIPQDLLRGLHDRSSSQCYQPVVVSGLSTVTYDGPAYAHYEAAGVKRLCALLSLVSEAGWEMKAAPADLEPPPWSNGTSEEFFKKLLTDRLRGEVGEAPDSVDPRYTLTSLDWLAQARDILKGDSWLENVLYTFHEARQLERNHPSVALLLYVATLDGMGMRLGARGTRRRVRASLDYSCDPDTARELYRAYELRNMTVHEGILHGLEYSYGAHLGSYLNNQVDDYRLRFSLTRPSRLACRRLLRAALRGRLSA